jgi:hypothetical protein
MGRLEASSRLGRVTGLLVLTACLGCGGDAAPAAASTQICEQRIIVSFQHDPGRAPDASFVTDLARATRVQLTFLRLAGPNLYVFSLSTSDPDPRCAAAIDRLRKDARIRSVDLDQQRRVQG